MTIALETVGLVTGAILGIAGVVALFYKVLKALAKVEKLIEDQERCKMYQNVQHKQTDKANKFMMKMLFEIIEILGGKKVNGQVDDFKKKLQIFNIDN